MDKAKIQGYFRDILGDLDSNDSTTAVAVMQAFEAAICDWMEYHQDQMRSYRDLHRQFLGAEIE